jgi:aminoglycoside phosphotransferase (APT) family kinase protein
LAAYLARAGAELVDADADVEIGPVDAIRKDAPMVFVPVSAVGPIRGTRPVRIVRRLAQSAFAQARAARAARVVGRLGYPQRERLWWDVEQRLRSGRPQRLVERFPRAAVVVGRRSEAGETLLQAAARAAAETTGRSVDASAARVTGWGTLVAVGDAGVLRVAIGPGTEQLKRQHRALADIAAREPPAAVASRLAKPVAAGAVGLGYWTLEERLPGSVPARVDAPLFAECVEFLVAVHLCARSRNGRPLASDAEVVAALSGAPQQPLVALARRLDTELTGVPRGFGHGDFWHKNILVDGGRLSGVVDWERAGEGRLPLLDLLQLKVTGARLGDRPFGEVIARHLLPWARAGGDATTLTYCERVGFAAPPAVLERLVLAFWLDRLAQELAKCGDKEVDSWVAENVRPVLAAAAS